MTETPFEPQFLTAWEREDYERQKRGQFPLGPMGAINADEIARLRSSIDRLLTCGNHIALYRTDRWPPYQLNDLTREQQCEGALRVLGATQDYDMWCCWSGMMQERDALEQ